MIGRDVGVAFRFLPEELGDLLQQVREDRIASTGRADRVVRMCSSWMGTEDASLATVLFADDDPDIRELGRLLLVKHGHEVVTAAEEAVAFNLPRGLRDAAE